MVDNLELVFRPFYYNGSKSKILAYPLSSHISPGTFFIDVIFVFQEPSLYVVKAILFLDNDGNRIISKVMPWSLYRPPTFGDLVYHSV